MRMKIPKTGKALLAGAALVGALSFADPAGATILTATDTLSSCAGGTAKNCTDTGYLSNTIASAITPFIGGSFPGANPALYDFTNAFNDWNAANGGGWTLVNGGTLNLSLSVSMGLSASSAGGGIGDIIVNISNYQPAPGGPSLSQLVWTQGLFVNYSPTLGNLATPDLTLDTYSLSKGSSGSGGDFERACAPIPGQNPGANNTKPATIGPTPANSAYCDPIYPFQYGSEYTGDTLDGVRLGTDFFFDAPEGAWPSDAFRGIDLLSTVTYDTNSAGVVTGKVLTVYQGIEYGFTLSDTPSSGGTRGNVFLSADLDVPEPGAGWLFVTALTLLGAMRAFAARQRKDAGAV